ncbi:uncharacterized protein LOC141651935 [Silene latifolia]|uniref:uncharacterized protein LOC141651935 n=1 Tax=Silene latifolia TaxID=37657 RepID=UPI003D7846D2
MAKSILTFYNRAVDPEVMTFWTRQIERQFEICVDLELHNVALAVLRGFAREEVLFEEVGHGKLEEFMSCKQGTQSKTDFTDQLHKLAHFALLIYYRSRPGKSFSLREATNTYPHSIPREANTVEKVYNVALWFEKSLERIKEESALAATTSYKRPYSSSSTSSASSKKFCFHGGLNDTNMTTNRPSGSDIPQSADAKTTKSVGEIVGIAPLDMDAIGEHEIISENEVAEELLVIPEVEDEATTNPDNEVAGHEDGWTQVKGRKHAKTVSDISPSSPPLLQLSMEDVQPEIDYWSTAVICYVLGGNPPWELLSGFVNRLWGKYKYDKISFLPNGAFLVHFPTLECRDLVLKQGFPMFDNKPLVVKPWSETTSLAKEKVKAVPIWIRLCGLGLKFWGEKTLAKLGSQFGTFMRADGATIDKTRLGYARLMVEVQVGQALHDKLFFKDEKGMDVCVLVEYEWRPDVCSDCKGIGHTTEQCRKKAAAPPAAPAVKPKQVQVWRPIVRPAPPQTAVPPRMSPPSPKFGGPTFHNSSVLIPVSPIIQLTRHDHITPPSPMKSYAEVVSDGESDTSDKNGGTGLYGLVETKVKTQDFTTILNNLGQHWKGINNNLHHPGGRVWVIWDPQVFLVTTRDCTAQQITVDVVEQISGDNFCFTVVYGFNDETDRKHLWRELQHLSSQITQPWCVCGDFNSIFNFNERLGRPVMWNELVDFRQCVESCDITDIQAQGSFFTWNNKQDHATRVYSRIDRCLVSNDWLLKYPDSYAYFMNEGLFDHTPIICYRKESCQTKKVSFRYFNMWGMDPDFKELVQMEWNKPVHGISMFQIVTKLRNLKKPLKLLNKNRFSDIEKATAVARQQLDDIQTDLQRQPGDMTLRQNEREAAKVFSNLQKAQFSFLQQKAKTEWLKEGDENTAFYHRKIKARQVHNKVLQIKDMQGQFHSDPEGIENSFLAYYQDLLGTSKPVKKIHVPTVSSGKTISPDHAAILLKPVTFDEVKEFNSTSITLIPKNANPVSVMEFRPIACCNTIYKCIAKLLCTRMGQVLPDIISSNQGGFIKGRNIVENILICQDIVRLYNRKATSPRCLVKIDLRKAYDTVEWDFLSQMLSALKFPEKFIDLVMVCVTSPSYSLSLNGNSFGFFKGCRGLRQGDPLSPLLFTICMEYLSRILKVVGHQQDFRFHPMCGPLQLNHLLFADDLLLFSKGDEVSIMWLLRAFSTFSIASGLALNKDKSDIYFNGMPQASINTILQVSGFKRGSLPFRYLGVPISSKKLTKNEGMKLIDKITARIRSWGARHLTYSGRLVLVNAVLSSLHSYWSSVFLIPNGILKKIDNICRNYL